MSAGSDSDRRTNVDEFVGLAERYYHYVAVALLMGLMLGIRLQPIDRFTGQETIHLQAVDSYYHWRTTQWTVNNFPFTMPYDVFTGFPSGRYVGQFGTLFDQFIATLAMIIGLGSPGDSDVLMAALIGVPLLATLVAIPVFLIGRRLGGRLGGVVAVALLALTPGEFLTRSTAGMFQHHAAEVLMMAVTVLAVMAAVRVAEREKPVWELVADRDVDGLRRPGLYSLAAGFAMGVYVWVWPPAVVMIGILGVFFVVAMAIDHVRGDTPEPLAFVGAVSMGFTAVMTLALLEVWSFNVTSMGLLAPVAALMVAFACVVLAGMSRWWYDHDYARLSYPAAVAGAGALGLVLLWLVLPGLYDTFVGNLTSRLIPLDPGVGTRTISEARPPSDPAQHFFDEYGLAFYSMLLGLGALVVRPFVGRRYRAEHTLVVVWSLFLISMALTQIRFSYYLVLAVAVVNGYLFGIALQWFGTTDVSGVRDIQGYQVLALILVVMVLFVPLLPPVAATNAMDVGDRAGPSADGLVWEGANLFLDENTPAVGDYGEHSNADELDYMGQYGQPGSGGYDYPDGSYGVMAWWDYGHLITTQANRIPHANPFQQNAQSAATYLLADSEDRAELILEAIAATGDGVEDRSDEAYQDMINDSDGDLSEEMRYVMVDDQVAAFSPGKMQALAAWTNDNFTDFTDVQEFDEYDPAAILQGEGDVQTGETINATGVSSRYDNTMVSRLYFGDASGLEHYRLVHESESDTLFGSIDLGGQGTLINTRLLEPLNELGGATPISLALESEVSLYDVRQTSQLKTFERVEGATLQGTATDANNTIVAELDLETNAGRNMTYTNFAQVDDDGTWEMTVPYASVLDRDVEDGYTEPAVTPANGTDGFNLTERTLFEEVAAGQVEVTESDVYDGQTVDVEMDEPANFDLDALDVPEQVDAGASFTVGTTVTNTGDTAGSQSVTFGVNDSQAANETVSLDPGDTSQVSFEHAEDNATEVEVVVATADAEESATVSVVSGDDGGSGDGGDDEAGDSERIGLGVPFGRTG